MQKLRIGTRGSPLALKQTDTVIAALKKVQPSIAVEKEIILTSGDWKPEHGETPLKADAGGKALFAKEIEQALLDGRIDAAVHSMKDIETILPDGLCIPWMLPREDVRDVVVLSDLSKSIQKFNDIPDDYVSGTTSARRQAFLLNKRPDIKVDPLRGNVQTRINKVRGGMVDFTFLAAAGLKRMGLENEIAFYLEPEEFLPSSGQGAVGIEVLRSRQEGMSIFSQINCSETYVCVMCERAVLEALEGSCHTPIGAYATYKDGEIWLRACVASLDGQQIFKEEERIALEICDVKKAQNFGLSIGQKLKTIVPHGVL